MIFGMIEKERFSQRLVPAGAAGEAAQCGGSKPDGIFGGHWPDCELAALLKESEVEK